MKIASIMLAAVGFAVAGKWVRGETVPETMVVGGIFVTLLLAFSAEANEELATKFAWLILAAIAGSNAEVLFTAIGGAADPTAKDRGTRR